MELHRRTLSSSTVGIPLLDPRQTAPGDANARSPMAATRRIQVPSLRAGFLRAKVLVQAAILLSLAAAAGFLLLGGSTPQRSVQRQTEAPYAVQDVLSDPPKRVVPAAKPRPKPPKPPTLPKNHQDAAGPGSSSSDSVKDAALHLIPTPRTKDVSYAEPWVLKGPRHKLPKCERILVFTFMPWWGFASEYILYTRAAAAAKKLGYTFVEDDRNWNYGRLSNYFQPRKLDCVPPDDWPDTRLALPLSPKTIRTRPSRLYYSRLNLSKLDDWTRETYLSSAVTVEQLANRRGTDREHAAMQDRAILEEGGTLPAPFERIFTDQSLAARTMWKPNSEVRSAIEAIKRQVGMTEAPWYAGENTEDGLGLSGGAADGQGRGPTIALHVRLGDKSSEYEHDAAQMGITNTFGNLSVYLQGAHDAYRRLIPSRYPALDPKAQRYSPYAPPTLVLITAEPDISTQLSADPLLAPFRLVQTPDPDVKSANVDKNTKDRLTADAKKGGKAGPKAYADTEAGTRDRKMVKRDEAPSLTTGYSQAAFNALPMLERVVHTQAFVRDLTLLAKETDAAIVSGASNIGRLAMMLAGRDAVVGPRTELGHSLGGKIRSVDAHWYPTAYADAVYHKIEDVEDLDNAAFLPEEQHAAEEAAQAAKAKAAKRRKRQKAAKAEKGSTG